MKSKFRVWIFLALTAAVLAAVTVCAGATELKTGIGYVQTDGLRLRAKPNTNAEVISTASYCDTVVVIRKVDDWYLVNYNLDIGYMNADYIIFKDREDIDLGFGMFNSFEVNLRSEPSTDGALVCRAPYEETAYVLGINNGWYKVKYEGQIGYVRTDLMDLTEKPPYNAESSSSSGGSSSSGSSSSAPSYGDQVVSVAMQYLGTPYVSGGTTPKGFECYGYTKYVYNKMGITLNRTAAQQLNNGYSVSNLQPGDLLFYKNTYAGAGAASHVGIYIGNNQFIHAGGGSVKITSTYHEYYASRYIGARRIF